MNKVEKYSGEEVQIFNSFTIYSFDNDPIFIKGKNVLLENLKKKDNIDINNQIENENKYLGEILRFKIYYWTKKYNKKINISRYNNWLKDGRPIYQNTNEIYQKETEIINFEERLNTYDFENDECFQKGVQALKEKFKDNIDILNNSLNEAKVYYLKKLILSENQMIKEKNENTINTSKIKENEINDKENIEKDNNQNNSNKEKDINLNEPSKEKVEDTNNKDSDTNQPKYPRSFYDLCELVANNKPIPGIKTIPNIINKGTPSKPSMAPRLKPWEINRDKKQNIQT